MGTEKRVLGGFTVSQLIIRGGRPLHGEITAQGAKNAALPILAATLLTGEEVRLGQIPHLEDVHTMKLLLEYLGAKVTDKENEVVVIAGENLIHEASYDLVSQMRASFLVAGPLLARFGKAIVPLPGGCAIGSRPVDLHLKGFQALGAKVEMSHGAVAVQADKLRGADIYLDTPSVTATENIMMAACLAEGTTVIENAAEEPEIVDLANFLNTIGARISGAGTHVIRIDGVRELHGGQYEVIPDRIEVGTYMVAAAITGGDVRINNIVVEHVKPVIAKLREAGVMVEPDVDSVTVWTNRRPKAITVKTLPHPGFPTDMQAPIMALLTVARGTSTVVETVFDNRFKHVRELNRMGANIVIDDRRALVYGVKSLVGTRVEATDLRAGAALVVAGLKAEGETIIDEVHHIDRGYVDIEKKLLSLGADIERKGNDPLYVKTQHKVN